jgi:hypothetical protein
MRRGREMEKEIQIEYLDLLEEYNSSMESILKEKYGIKVVKINVSHIEPG